MSFDDLDNRRAAMVSGKRFSKESYMDQKRMNATVNKMIVSNDKYFNLNPNTNERVANRNINSTNGAKRLQAKGNQINGNYRYDSRQIARNEKKEGYSDSSQYVAGTYVYRI